MSDLSCKLCGSSMKLTKIRGAAPRGYGIVGRNMKHSGHPTVGAIYAAAGICAGITNFFVKKRTYKCIRCDREVEITGSRWD